MKNLTILLIMMFISAASFCQAGLNFSQCLTFSSNGPWTPVSPNSSDKTSPLITVPEGKIWKIEQAYVFPNSSQTYLNVNGIKASQLASGIEVFPIWLKSGDNLNFLSSGPTSYFLSILEFNSN